MCAASTYLHFVVILKDQFKYSSEIIFVINLRIV